MGTDPPPMPAPPGDPLALEVYRRARETRLCTVLFVQREAYVGYVRATKIIDELVGAGLLTPVDGPGAGRIWSVLRAPDPTESLEGDSGSVDDLKKLLDNGHSVVVFHSEMGDYTAAVANPALKSAIAEALEEYDPDPLNKPDRRITSHFTPTKALRGLVEKFTTGSVL